MIGEEQPQVAATHRSRPWWRRPRLGIGVLLVAGSVAVGTWAVRSAAAGEPAWVAVRDLAPGAAVSAQDLREVTLRWDGASGTYLAPADLTADSVVTSFVGEGELVPTSALGTTGDVAGRPMAVAVPVGGSPRPGSLVDLWFVPSAGSLESAEAVAADVEVLEITAASGVLGSSSGQVATVLVPEESVADVLGAQARRGEVTLVEHPGG
ncbi:hypothetical protein ATL40_1921 [Serinibacter salmoneus]|uniref:SAF domain-containing protein n=2 Tax=Serinibacter salmoneus TaxID=556530 RepID=A0A2A9D104_9MICO|nr:hypothetical protein ATL40_1921 [Serinibacter salmoneus]